LRLGSRKPGAVHRTRPLQLSAHERKQSLELEAKRGAAGRSEEGGRGERQGAANTNGTLHGIIQALSLAWRRGICAAFLSFCHFGMSLKHERAEFFAQKFD
jgi:hypothetical protein